jgi:hypothetical protein
MAFSKSKNVATRRSSLHRTQDGVPKQSPVKRLKLTFGRLLRAENNAIATTSLFCQAFLRTPYGLWSCLAKVSGSDRQIADVDNAVIVNIGWFILGGASRRSRPDNSGLTKLVDD